MLGCFIEAIDNQFQALNGGCARQTLKRVDADAGQTADEIVIIFPWRTTEVFNQRIINRYVRIFII